MFRGDSRGGLDPYWLGFDHSGTNLIFHIDNDQTFQGAEVSIPFTWFGQWTHVAGVLDDSTGTMTLFINGVQVSQIVTSVRPSGALQANFNPGIGIGALQNNGDNASGYAGEFFHGKIDEVRISDTALAPSGFLNARSAAVPEPAGLVLASLGTVALAGYRSLRHRTAAARAGRNSRSSFDAPAQVV